MLNSWLQAKSVNKGLILFPFKEQLSKNRLKGFYNLVYY